MKIHYTGRQVEITPLIKSLVEEKLNKIHKILGPHLDLEAHVILSQERHLCSSEVTLNLKNHLLVGISSTPDSYGSLQEAMEKLEKRVIKYKDRGRVLKRRSREPRLAKSEGEVERRNGRPRRRGAAAGAPPAQEGDSRNP